MTRSGVLPKSLGLGPIIVYLASAINIALVVLVIVTAGRAVSGKLQAQEDFGVFAISASVASVTRLSHYVIVVTYESAHSKFTHSFSRVPSPSWAFHCTVPFLCGRTEVLVKLASVRNLVTLSHAALVLRVIQQLRPQVASRGMCYLSDTLALRRMSLRLHSDLSPVRCSS